jgi:MerR family copper efflux transcriptional regulator
MLPSTPPARPHTMTIGQLSRRTGVPIKTLREYERLGFLYTQGRSASNYRLFGDEAVWCVQVIQGFRSLGLTLKEIEELVTLYRAHPDVPIDGLLEAHLARALTRFETRIVELQALRQRILDFQAARTQAQTPLSPLARLLASDPSRTSAPSTS